MTPRTMSLVKRIREHYLLGARHQTVHHPRDAKGRWFCLGYQQAIHDIERSGSRPLGDEAIREMAEHALRTWVETGVFPQ
jgi:hypothetical protein